MINDKYLPFEKKKKRKKTEDELWLTICCRLTATEQTREFLWKEMEKYTLFVNELFIRINQLDDFQKCQIKGSIARSTVEMLCKLLKEDQRFKDLSCRCYPSATSMVAYTYESWLELQQKKLWRLNGKKRWLKAIEDDIELAKVTDFSAQQIQARAQKLLEEFDLQQGCRKTTDSLQESSQLNSSQDEDSSEREQSLFTFLFQKHSKEIDLLCLRAIVHLLKNEGQVDQAEENYEQLLLKLAIKGEVISRLEEQLKGQLPKGRDVTDERGNSLLKEAVEFLPAHSTCKPPLFLFKAFLAYVYEQVDYVKYGVYLLKSIAQEAKVTQTEFFAWEDSVFRHLVNVSKIPNSLPYPIILGSADDINWSSLEKDKKEAFSSSSQTSQAEDLEIKARKRPHKRRRKKLASRSNKRIFVGFKGFSGRTFGIQCDRRHLQIFRQMTAEWEELKKLSDEDKFSLGLFPLRSAYLIWKPDEKKLCKSKKSKPKLNESEQVTDASEEAPPWQTHRLFLHCVVDSRLLTAEGTEEVRQEKIKKTEKLLEKAQGKEEELQKKLDFEKLSNEEREGVRKELIDKQRKIKSIITSLHRLRNNTPPRPSRTSYSGDPNRVMAIAFCLQDLAGAVIFDSDLQQTLSEYTLENLLVKEVSQSKRHQSIENLRLEQYRLVERLRNMRKQRPVQRLEEQRLYKHFEGHSQSNRAQYLERLVAARAIAAAKQWNAGVIIIPRLEGIRESIESAIRAKAKQLFPNQKELQRKYGKEARELINEWSYKRFSDCIRSCARKGGISVQTHQQPVNSNLMQKAIGLAQKGTSHSATTNE